LELPKKIKLNEKTEISNILLETPKSSLTQISQETGLSRTSIWRYLRWELGQKSYIIQTHQELFEDDLDRRVEMAEKLSGMLLDKKLNNLIYFSDEATFHISGYVHKNNCRIWGTEPPNMVNVYTRDAAKVNVWCAMSSDCIIGPNFFDGDSITGEIYKKMLENFFFPIVRKKRLMKSIIFQQDGAPAHYSTSVRRLLDHTFPGRWIGRRGPIEWAPRSPDLTPLDFFLWGYTKQLVYCEPIKDLEQLRQKITETVKSINKDLIKKVFLNISKRLDKVIETGGCHIEQLL